MLTRPTTGKRKSLIFAPLSNGDLLEWLKRHAWKVCIPLKGIEGSNPSVSAFALRSFSVGGLFFSPNTLFFASGYGGHRPNMIFAPKPAGGRQALA